MAAFRKRPVTLVLLSVPARTSPPMVTDAIRPAVLSMKPDRSSDGISGVDAPADEVVADLHHAHVVLAENPAAVASRPAAERAADGDRGQLSPALDRPGKDRLSLHVAADRHRAHVAVGDDPGAVVARAGEQRTSNGDGRNCPALDVCGGRPRAAQHVAADPYRARACADNHSAGVARTADE